MRQLESVTNPWRRFAMVRVQKSARQFTSQLAAPSMWRSSQASLLEILLVRSFQLRSVELDVFWMREMRSVMTRSLSPLLMFLRKCVT